MTKYKCPICKHVNEKELNGENRYRCDKCTRIVRAIKAPRSRRTKAEMEAEKQKEEALKARALEKKLDLDGNGKVDEQEVSLMDRAVKTFKKNKKTSKKKKKDE